MKLWIWALGAAGVGYYLYTKDGAAALPGEETVPEDTLLPGPPGTHLPAPPGAYHEDSGGSLQIDRQLDTLCRTLLNVIHVRMPWLGAPPVVPARNPQGLADEMLADISDEFDSCFGTDNWWGFVYGSFGAESGRAEYGEDARRVSRLRAFIAFFKGDTGKLNHFLHWHKDSTRGAAGSPGGFSPSDRPGFTPAPGVTVFREDTSPSPFASLPGRTGGTL